MSGAGLRAGLVEVARPSSGRDPRITLSPDAPGLGRQGRRPYRPGLSRAGLRAGLAEVAQPSLGRDPPIKLSPDARALGRQGRRPYRPDVSRAGLRAGLRRWHNLHWVAIRVSSSLRTHVVWAGRDAGPTDST
ncbi:hypothetical protein NCCP691_16990 [Noviherbaspirillum aridicola]|uniref:Uncharacterized protein n=1 Tax=Noviherbaspirillum aridicola TaxID=2849687 RepID=A0ABQ4Q4G1_9BURK|nr:hypothetical protein NCCP691_16990 [Noviherbaspirillum aridicola]